MGPDSIRNFVELMQYSDVIINLGSTVTLDAIVHDTPVICPNIQFRKPVHFWDNIDLRYRNNHTEIVAASGAIGFPHTMEELCEEVVNALSNPSDKRSQRKKLEEKLIPTLPTSKLIRESIEKTI